MTSVCVHCEMGMDVIDLPAEHWLKCETHPARAALAAANARADKAEKDVVKLSEALAHLMRSSYTDEEDD